MDLKTCKDKSLKLINQYSINGQIVGADKNADYLMRMNSLIDACQKELSDKIDIVKDIAFTQVSDQNATDYKKYSLPTNTKKVVRVELKNNLERYDIDYVVEGLQLLINPQYDGTVYVAYTKFPEDIDDTTTDDIELEIRLNAQELVPYYVSGHIYLEDNPTIATTLLNTYESKYAKLDTTKVYSKPKRVKAVW